MSRRIVLAVALLLVAGLASWRIATGPEAEPDRSTTTPTTAVAAATDTRPDREPPEPGAGPDDLSAAESEPGEDSYYPRVGDPGVDALHYGLGLDWDPGTRVLTGTAEITFRATADADRVVLDLGAPLTVDTVTLDGGEVGFDHPGKNLVLDADVTEDTTYVADVRYHGTPRPVQAPTLRSDFSTTGWTTVADGRVWTMQEPFGAYTWYPVHDQPSDKAYYDFAVSVPAPWVGVTNGALTSQEEVDGRTVTTFDLDQPAASYLTTIAIGPYESRSAEGPGGVPITTWAEDGGPTQLDPLDALGPAMRWVERRLGPYPFATVGAVVVPSDSAMETQTTMTFGDNDYVLSEAVIVHELVHQWYGDTVTPDDWRDVWLSEGMTMFVQLAWEADRDGVPVGRAIRDYTGFHRGGDQGLRDEAGPPGAYNPVAFGASNIYTIPASMYAQLYRELGAREFWRIAAAWVVEQRNRSVDREELYAFWERETGRELSDWFDAWIEGTVTPPPGVPG